MSLETRLTAMAQAVAADIKAIYTGKQAVHANLAALSGLTGVADRLPYFTGAGALDLATLTDLARTLLGDTTQTGMQSTLGLVKQSSVTDTAAGVLLIVGAGGVALPTTIDPAHNWPATSLNDCTGASGGFWRTIGSTTDRPVGFSTACVVDLQIRQVLPGVTINYTQRVTDNTTGATAVRSSTGAGTVAAPNWLPWRYLWDAAGTNAITVDTGSFGYGTGSGGTVTQATSKATGVTLNKPTGAITLNGAALAAGAVVSFTLTNNKIAAADVPLVVIKSGATAGAYTVQVDGVVTGSCRISLRNQSAGPLSEAIVLSFILPKGATA
jgi:hypothetical protein